LAQAWIEPEASDDNRANVDNLTTWTDDPPVSEGHAGAVININTNLDETRVAFDLGTVASPSVSLAGLAEDPPCRNEPARSLGEYRSSKIESGRSRLGSRIQASERPRRNGDRAA
jgi:hypothetical protein